MKLEQVMHNLEDRIQESLGSDRIPLSDFTDGDNRMVRFYCDQEVKESELLSKFKDYEHFLGVVFRTKIPSEEITLAKNQYIEAMRCKKSLSGIEGATITASVISPFSIYSEDLIALREKYYEGIRAAIKTLARDSKDKTLKHLCDKKGRDRIKQLLFSKKEDLGSYHCSLIADVLKHYKDRIDDSDPFSYKYVLSGTDLKVPPNDVASKLFQAQLDYAQSESERLYH